MKLFVVAALFGLCAADRLDNKYLPPRGNAGAGYSSIGSSGSFGSSSGNFGSSGFGHSGAQNLGQSAGYNTQYSGNIHNAAPQQYNAYSQQQYHSNSADANAQILRQNSDVTAESFSYDFETSNGIRADASGVATNGVQSHGSFAYKGDDGQDYSITYTADENGYRPQGAHLPTPPPIPEAILKSLEQNARDEAAGISDDGSYHGEGASGSYSGSYSAPSAPSTQYGAPARIQSSFGGQSHFGGQSSGNFGGQSQYSAQSGSSFGSRSSNFGGAASRQYLAPKASGNGNFNTQSGYRY